MTKTLLALLATAGLTTAIPTSNILQKRASPSSTLPTCFYDYGCPIQCTSSPNFVTCQQSIDAVCKSVSTATPNGHDQWFNYVTNNGTVNPAVDYWTPDPYTDCLAIVRVSASLTQFPSEVSCQQSFGAIQGCAQTTNQNYSPTCVGGSINVQYCNDNHGLLVDAGMAAYVLGTPNELHVAPAENHALTDADKKVATVGNLEATSKIGPLTMEEYEYLISPP